MRNSAVNGKKKTKRSTSNIPIEIRMRFFISMPTPENALYAPIPQPAHPDRVDNFVTTACAIGRSKIITIERHLIKLM